MMHRIVALDPGGTTGAASVTTGVEVTHFQLFTFPTWSRIDEIIQTHDTVIVEKPFQSPNVDPVVFMVYGSILERCQTLQVPLVDQPPNIPHFIQRRWDILDKMKGKAQHEKDAFGHLVFYLTNLGGWTIQQCYALLQMIPPA